MEGSSLLRYSSADRIALRGLDPSGPQIDVESGFQPSEGGDVSPSSTGQNIANGRVIDACERFRSTQASIAKSLTKRECEEPGCFGDLIITGGLGPVRAVGIGGGSYGSRHEPIVVINPAESVDTTTNVTPLNYAVGSNQLLDRGLDPMTKRINNFTPEMPERYWAVIETFVRAAVTDAQPSTVYSAHNLLSSVSRHVLWCWQSAGLELERKVIFDPLVIEEYIVKGCLTLAPASRGNRRSQLLRVAEVLCGSKSCPLRLTPLPPSEPVRPYSVCEITALRSWATGQATPTRRRDAATLLSLGAGAGLAGEDIAQLRAHMVTVDDMGVLVAVPGRRTRLVPVLFDWEGPLVEAARVISSERPLFGEGRTTTNKNFVSNFVAKSCGVGPRPSVQRLRATWIVHHLAARTPVVPFMTAAGVRSLEAITRYLCFVPDIDPVEARRALRCQLMGGELREGPHK
jgi:hypothetical protein